MICSELLRTWTKETFLFEIFFHFSPIETFPFGLFLMRHILVFQVNAPNSAYFFYNFRILHISCEQQSISCLVVIDLDGPTLIKEKRQVLHSIGTIHTILKCLLPTTIYHLAPANFIVVAKTFILLLQRSSFTLRSIE